MNKIYLFKLESTQAQRDERCTDYGVLIMFAAAMTVLECAGGAVCNGDGGAGVCGAVCDGDDGAGVEASDT